MATWWSEPTSQHAFILSVISLVITFVAALVGIIASKQLGSSLILVYGLENAVDFISSAIVLWRFFAPNSPNSETETQATEAKLAAREKRASIGITVILAILGFGGIITSSGDFAAGQQEEIEEHLWALYYLSFLSLVVFGIMAVFKFRYAKKLSSPSLKKDGICSAIGTILAGAMFFNAVLSITSQGSLWWFDPLMAMFCGIGALGYGIWGMHKAYVRDGYPIFSCSFWWYGGSGREFTPATTSTMQNDLEMNSVGNGNGNISASAYGNGNVRNNINVNERIMDTSTRSVTSRASVGANAMDTVKEENELGDDIDEIVLT
jgi:hypothetical protein